MSGNKSTRPVRCARAIKTKLVQKQYIEFIKSYSHDFHVPSAWAHNRVEGSTEYTQLLVCAKVKHRRTTFLLVKAKAGVKLYVKRVFIMDEAHNLIPN